jgi:hypothetical protein
LCTLDNEIQKYSVNLLQLSEGFKSIIEEINISKHLDGGGYSDHLTKAISGNKPNYLRAKEYTLI